MNSEQETALYDQPTEVPYEVQLTSMSDRDILEAIALDMHNIRVLFAEVAEQAGPLLNSPSFKLLSKML